MANSDGLVRMRRLLAELGSPEKDLKVIHIAGTNGKGSTAVMIASILEHAGYSVGLYTSPHLELECERVQIWDGEHRMIEQSHFDELMDRVRDIGSRISSAAVAGVSEYPADGGSSADPDEVYGPLHVFEVYTAAAYLYFAEEQPDYVVLECGLGGRLDSTNTIDKPLCSVITQIGLDHTADLGNTVIKVAREKAGIIKKGVPVISQTPDMMIRNVIQRIARERDAEFIDASAEADRYRSYEIGLQGDHQLRNAATAVMAVRAAGIDVPESAVREGLKCASNPGRFEVLGTDPYWIIDGAHNVDAVAALADAYEAFARRNRIRRTLVIFGCMKDKNAPRMIQLLTERLRGCEFRTAAVDYGRAEDPEKLAGLFADRGRSCVCYDSVKEAFDDAVASDFECVLITGSIYLAGEMRSYYLA